MQVALQLSISIVLLSTLVFMVVREMRKSRVKPVEELTLPPETAPSTRPTTIPHRDPSSPNPFKNPAGPTPPAGGKYPRWNLKDFPGAWNEGIAQALHSFFEALEYDSNRPIDMNRIEKIRDDLKDYLAQLDPDSIPTLATILNAETDFVYRRMILTTIGELGPESTAATFVLRDFFMARYSDPQNRSEMLHVVKAMSYLQNDTSYDTLMDLIDRGHSNPSLHKYRDRFVEALGDHPRGQEAVGTLLETLENDQLPEARNKSAQALGKVATSETLPTLFNAVEKEPYWVVKQTTLGTIGKIGDPSALPFLEMKARSAKESSTRLSAGNAIRTIGTAEGERILGELAKDEPDPEIRKRFQDWLNGKPPGGSNTPK